MDIEMEALINAKLGALEARVEELEKKNCSLEGRLEQMEQENEEYKDMGEKLTRRLERLKKYTIQSNAIMREMLFPEPGAGNPGSVAGTRERSPQRRVTPPSVTTTTESQESRTPTESGDETETEEEKSATLTQENCRGLLAIKKLSKGNSENGVSFTKNLRKERKAITADNKQSNPGKYHSKAAKRILSKLAAEKAALGGNGTTTTESNVESTQEIIRRSKKLSSASNRSNRSEKRSKSVATYSSSLQGTLERDEKVRSWCESAAAAEPASVDSLTSFKANNVREKTSRSYLVGEDIPKEWYTSSATVCSSTLDRPSSKEGSKDRFGISSSVTRSKFDTYYDKFIANLHVPLKIGNYNRENLPSPVPSPP